jgi:hypothetical protein
LGAIGLAFRAAGRRRWRSWIAISVLISVVGGLVLAATAAGRRTDAAFPRFVATHGFDLIEYASQPQSGLTKIPGVVSATEFISPDNGRPTCRCAHPINQSDFAIGYLAHNGPSPIKLVSGRLPDPSAPDQVLASFTLQHDDGVRLGTVIHVPLFAPSQGAAVSNASGALPTPKGPSLNLEVVGFAAGQLEFDSAGTPSYFLYVTPALAHAAFGKAADSYVYFVRLRHGAEDVPRFDAAATALNAGTENGYSNQDGAVAAVQTSIHPQAVGWWILGALAALVGLAVIGQALARQSIVESADYPTMAAVGADRRQLVALGMARSLVVGLAGSLGAVVVATALSPVAPLGEARAAESSTGVQFDPLVLLLGALGIVLVVLGLSVWPAVRGSRTTRSDNLVALRPSAVVGHLAAIGVPPSAFIGVRNALQRKSIGSTVPIGSALLGTVLAVLALSGTAVFGASLSHLTATPKLYGDSFGLDFSSVGSAPGLLAQLEHDRAVTGIVRGSGTEVTVNGVTVGGVEVSDIRGRLPISVAAGQLPSGDRELGLGSTTMRATHTSVGSIVRVTVSLPSGGKRTEPFRVVSRISFPLLGGAVSLGTGALLPAAGAERVACPPGAGLASCRTAITDGASQGGGSILATFVPGPRGQAAINRYLVQYQAIASLPTTPTSLVNFGEAVNFPLLFGAILAVSGAATLAHLLVVSVSRRRQEVGLLKVLGFVNGQVVSSVAWQATTLALVGVVIGVPLGVALGQVVWRDFANNLGVVPVSIVPIALLGLIVAAVLVAANLVAMAPALLATRSRPGELLRTS